MRGCGEFESERRSPTMATNAATPGSMAAGAASDPRDEEFRRHLSRYRELSPQGKWAEAGKELEAIEGFAKK
jgi:hypothetical protein